MCPLPLSFKFQFHFQSSSNLDLKNKLIVAGGALLLEVGKQSDNKKELEQEHYLEIRGTYVKQC